MPLTNKATNALTEEEKNFLNTLFTISFSDKYKFAGRIISNLFGNISNNPNLLFSILSKKDSLTNEDKEAYLPKIELIEKANKAQNLLKRTQLLSIMIASAGVWLDNSGVTSVTGIIAFFVTSGAFALHMTKTMEKVSNHNKDRFFDSNGDNKKQVELNIKP